MEGGVIMEGGENGLLGYRRTGLKLLEYKMTGAVTVGPARNIIPFLVMSPCINKGIEA